ncbi:hypothetical protein CHISP_0136 [Chitinispirillum alkaliphilum]|nr:hypothetical protein CHISP_0136 [Chitinispirillum alkaliphilum]
MSKYSIAFITPSKKPQIRHRIITGENRDNALRQFFTEETNDFYSADDQGFYYFKEDFFDETSSSGSIIEVE